MWEEFRLTVLGMVMQSYILTLNMPGSSVRFTESINSRLQKLCHSKLLTIMYSPKHPLK
ncbi:hypothetical protein D3C75_685430 [compost metagenome]